ncbi:MAG: thioredoxin family protein [Legionella sp.]|nr:thioredoxin family protein [Legionella sp.]
MAMQSNMLVLGTKAPLFKLLDVRNGNLISLPDQKGEKATVIMFICNHCPYVKHVNPALVRLANDYSSKGVAFVAISSNDVQAYPDDSPENMKKVALELNYPFPYVYDETQTVAKAYDAACTPDFYVFDTDLKLFYRGQLDDSRPANTIPVSGESIRYALDCILKNKPFENEQKPSIGCGIKWC